MSQSAEIIRENIAAFKATPVANAELLQDSIIHAEANPETVARAYYGYYRVIRDLLHLSPDEIAIISQVNARLNKHRGADEFLASMTGQSETIMTALRQVGSLDINNQQGLTELTDMMNNARNIKLEDPNWKPTDGDPKSDRVIWGFVNGANTPEIDIHFALCHGIERSVTQSFKGTPSENTTSHKDWLLSAMTDVIALRGLQGRGYEAQVLDMWSTPRKNGLGWISQERLAAYRELLG